MHKLTINASDGETLTGHLPTGWHEVPLGPYAALVDAAQPLPDSLPADAAHALTSPAACRAWAALLGLPTAEPLLADPSLLLAVRQAAPWLWAGGLPESGTPAPSFTHQGVSYTYAGDWHRLTAGQLEALLTFLRAHQGHPLGCGPHLLAVLYTPTGQVVTPEVVAATATAFATLPLSVAWPALASFTMRSAPWVATTHRFSVARAGVAEALSALEQALTSPTSAPRGSCWNMGRWLGRAWIRRARRVLTTCLPPSATTAPCTMPTSPAPGAGADFLTLPTAA